MNNNTLFSLQFIKNIQKKKKTNQFIKNLKNHLFY